MVPRKGSTRKTKATSKPVTAAVTITIGTETIEGTVSSLHDPDWFASVQKGLRTKKAVRVHIHKLLSLSDRDRWSLLSFIVGIGRNAAIRVPQSKQDAPNILDAVLSAISKDRVLRHRTRARLAAIEAAVLLYPTGLEMACEHIADEFKAARVKGAKLGGLLRDARKILENINRSQANARVQSEKTVKAILDDAPVAETIVVPSGWSLTESGTTCMLDDDVAGHIPAPVLIIGRLNNPAQEIASLQIAWFRDGKWKSTIVDRAVVASSRTIVELSSHGLPVTSNNAKTLVQYLADFETENLPNLPISIIADQMGWHRPDGRTCFLLGHHVITSKGIADPRSAGSINETGRTHLPIHFRGADDGDTQMASGFHSRGSYEGWKDAIRAIKDFPRARLALYSGFVPPLLSILRTPSFVVSLSGETTAGKTTILGAVASVWGAPNGAPTNHGFAMYSWNGTAVWKERTRTVLRDLPFVIDDTKHARNPQEVADVIYEVSQGLGKGRGSQKGLAKLQSCRTVMVTSGEQPATSHTQDGGTRSRVLELWGSPFGKRSPANGILAQQLTRCVLEHYGHAGPRFVQHLIRNEKLWPEWRNEFLRWRSHYANKAGANPIAGRMAEHFAALCTAAWLAHKFLDLPWEFKDPVAPLWEQLSKEAGEADRASAALRDFMAWATANQARFYFEGAGTTSTPAQGWVGRWDNRAEKGSLWKWIGILPTNLRELLAGWKYDFEATIRVWKQRNWLILTKDNNSSTRSQHRAWIANNNARIYAIRREVIEKELGFEPREIKTVRTTNTGNRGNASGNRKGSGKSLFLSGFVKDYVE